MLDDLQQARDAWIDRLVTDICEHWGHKIEFEVLAPQVQSDPLLTALILSRITEGDTRAWPPAVIADDLRGTGLLADMPTERVVSGLVLPVVRVLRSRGAPWTRWWDVAGLSLLLLELWTGRRLEACSEDAVAAELMELWRIEEDVLASLLGNSARPFRKMPAELDEDSARGAAAQLFRELIEAGAIDLYRHEDVRGVHPELENRADLVQVARRLRQRLALGQALPLVRDMPPAKRQAIAQDLESFDGRMASMLNGLTWYEVMLIRGVDPDGLYRDRCLVAGQGIYQHWLLEGDSLPPAIEFCSGGDVPRWIHDEVITGGGRSFRTNVGPHPVWLATAETPAHVASMRMLATAGTTCGVKHEISVDKVVLWLILPLAPGDPGPAPEAPYVYSLDIVNAAWQLLLVASAGYVRLTAVRLTDEGEPRLIGAVVLTLPPDVCAELGAVATSALRKLVGDDLQSLLWRRGTEGLDHQAPSAFYGNETAKGEDLRDEFVLPLEHRAHPAWDQFREAARELAQARSRLAAAMLDGRPDASLRDDVVAAVENRQRTLEVARADTRSAVRRSRAEDIVQALSEDQDAFVHLFMLNDRLSGVIGRVADGRPQFELLPHSDISVQGLTNAVETWSQLSHARVGQEWYRYFGMLVTACEELIRALAEALKRQGITRVFLSPTAPLDLLPLHAVLLENDCAVFLGDVFTDIAYMPTAHLLKAVAQIERRPATCPAVVVAHDDESALFEAEMVADFYEGASLLTGEGATPDAVLQAMTGARIVHITSHGYTHANRWASGVELHGESRGESTLTTSRIFAGADLSSVDLVVLNACRTGTHESTARVVQTLRGVESAFLARGAKAIVSTLWEITNLHAAVFSALLHAHVTDGESVADSYRAAIEYLRHGQWIPTARQTWRTRKAGALLDEAFNGVLDDWREHLTRQADDDPFFWAAFKITGSL